MAKTFFKGGKKMSIQMTFSELAKEFRRDLVVLAILMILYAVLGLWIIWEQTFSPSAPDVTLLFYLLGLILISGMQAGASIARVSEMKNDIEALENCIQTVGGEKEFMRYMKAEAQELEKLFQEEILFRRVDEQDADAEELKRLQAAIKTRKTAFWGLHRTANRVGFQSLRTIGDYAKADLRSLGEKVAAAERLK